MVTTTVPALSGDQFVQRLAGLFPPGWASADAVQSGNLNAFLKAIGGQLAGVLGGVEYTLEATRLQTATAPELDLASVDFFGDTLPRPDGMSDASFAALIISNLFRQAATRPALFTALTNLCGQPPRMLEPWSVLDTGWWDGISYWDADTAANPARWGDGSLRYQGFIETAPPRIPSVGTHNPVLTWDTAYWDNPGYFFGTISTTPLSAIYDLVNRIKAEGTLVWVKLVASSADAAGNPAAPSPVRNLAVSTSTASATVSWSAPASGNPQNYAYTVFYRVSGADTFQAGPTLSSSPAQVTGLQSNQAYDFEVIVRNIVGQAPSNIVTATTLKVPPGPATNLTVSNLGTTILTLSWLMPATGTPPFICSAQYRVSGTTTWIPFGTAGSYTTITITGLTPNTSYDLEVITTNDSTVQSTTPVVGAITSDTGVITDDAGNPITV